MSATVDVSQSDVTTILRAFLLSLLPDGTEVILGQVNRVPEPESPDFVIFWPLRRVRLATNLDAFVGITFTGAISGSVLTVSDIARGEIAVGDALFGVGLADGTVVKAFLTGTGGVGTYTVVPSQDVGSAAIGSFAIGTSPIGASGITVSSGSAKLMQSTDLTFQLDVHGPNSSDNAEIISTTFRDDIAVEFFNTDNALVTPLLADDPRFVPFINDQNQYEDRWIVEARIQVDATVSITGTQFADAVSIILKDVDVVYPPPPVPPPPIPPPVPPPKPASGAIGVLAIGFGSIGTP